MGRIKPGDGEVSVEFSLDEMLLLRARLRLPPDERIWFDSIGNFVSRAAWEILKEKAPHLLKTFNVTDVSGVGKITITFKESSDE